jgi:hypothetical protein
MPERETAMKGPAQFAGFARRAIVRVGDLLAYARMIARGLLAAQGGVCEGDRPEVILHAGEHKTGTTTLQAVIRRERGKLGRQAVHVLRTGQGSDGAHHRLIYFLTGQPRSTESLNWLRAELALAPPHKVLISSETAKKSIVNGDGHRLVDALRSAGAGRVRLLLYVRSPFGLANASYSGRTGRLELAGASFEDFLKSHDVAPAYRYDRFLDLAERDDVDLVVRPYSEDVRRSVVSDFAKAIGVCLDGITEPRHNGSFGPVGLEAMRLIAAQMGEIEIKLRHRLRNSLRNIARQLPEEPFWGMDPGREALLRTADSRTEAFARAVWGRGWREVIGKERRPLNVFDPADAPQRALLDSTLRHMNRAAADLLR